MASMAAREAEMLEPWRKNFPLCKPYAAHYKADAVRFLRELEEGCNGTDADTDWTLGDVPSNAASCSGESVARKPAIFVSQK